MADDMTDDTLTVEITCGGETIELNIAQPVVDLYEAVAMPELDEPMSPDRVVAHVIRESRVQLTNAAENSMVDLHQQVRQKRAQERAQEKRAKQLVEAAPDGDGGEE